MKTERNFWESVGTWFTISRVLITFWNIVAFCYHVFIIGIGSWTSVVIQITALITEYIVSGPYERMLLWSNDKINKKEIHTSFSLGIFIKLLIKITTFTLIFSLVYHTTYYLRLQFFQLIDFGINSQQLMRTMINMVWFTALAGPIMGFVVIWRKNKKRREALDRRFIRRV